MPFMRQCGKIL